MSLRKVVHLSESLVIGGAERVILQTSAGMKDRGVDLVLCALSRHPTARSPYLDSAQELGLRGIGIPCRGRFDRQAVERVAGFLEAENSDLLCCHGYKGDLIGRLASRRLGIPAIAYLHGWTASTWQVRAYEAIDRRMLRWMDGVVAVSEPIRRIALASGVSEERLFLIPNGVDPAAFRPLPETGEVRRELGIGKSGPVIGSVGRLSREKGHRYLLDALERVFREGPRGWLVLVGDGPERPSLERQARDLGISAWVRFTGFREDVRRLLSAFDLFVLPSLTEGVPVGLLEAMACKCPVVATAVGGVPGVVLDGRTGCLVPPADPVQLAVAIRASLLEPGESRRRAELAYVLVCSEYSLDRQIIRLMEAFEQVIRYHRKSSAKSSAACR